MVSVPQVSRRNLTPAKSMHCVPIAWVWPRHDHDGFFNRPGD